MDFLLIKRKRYVLGQKNRKKFLKKSESDRNGNLTPLEVQTGLSKNMKGVVPLRVEGQIQAKTTE